MHVHGIQISHGKSGRVLQKKTDAESLSSIMRL